MSERVCCFDLVSVVASAVSAYRRSCTNFSTRRIHRKRSQWKWVQRVMHVSSAIWPSQLNSFHFHGTRLLWCMLAADYCSRCCRGFWPAMAAESNHLQMLSNRLWLNCKLEKSDQEDIQWNRSWQNYRLNSYCYSRRTMKLRRLCYSPGYLCLMQWCWLDVINVSHVQLQNEVVVLVLTEIENS